jgi:predicted ATPase
MLFGLAGAHRSGKSTLARRLADKLNMHYAPFQTTELMRAAGYDGVANLSVEDRMTAQERLLDAALAFYDALPRPVITDRTPLDMLGYLLAEIGMHGTPPDIADRAASYHERALQETRLRFDAIMVLRPLPHYEADPTKPPPNRAYQWHHQFIVEGAAMNLGYPIDLMLLTMHPLDERIETAGKFIESSMITLRQELEAVSIH